MYTDNLLTADPSHYPPPRSWFSATARTASARTSLPPDREDIQLLEQMVCNEMVVPAGGVSQLVKGLRTARDSGAHWLSVFANDLLEVSSMARTATALAPVQPGLPVAAPSPVPAPSQDAGPAVGAIAEVEQCDKHGAIEEVVMDEWPVANARTGEDQHYRTVDALQIGATLSLSRDDGRQMIWRVEQRCPKTLTVTLVDASGNRRMSRTRSGLAAELRRGACQVMVEQPRPAGLLSRLAAVFGISSAT